jgi:hypothetical protein
VELVQDAMDRRGEDDAGRDDQHQAAEQRVAAGEQPLVFSGSSGPMPARIMAALAKASIQGIPSN